MNDRRAKIGDDSKEVEMVGLVNERAGHSHGQGTRIDTRVSVRVATPRDAERLRGMFSRVSSETIHQRFHLPYPDVPEWMLTLMLNANHHDKEVLVAVAEEEIVGHAMYVRLDEGSEAEMAIIVEDGWQSKGVGKSLLSELAKRALLGGVGIFTAEVLGTNQRMLGLAAMFAETDYTTKGDLCHVRMLLRTLEPMAYDAACALRRAA